MFNNWSACFALLSQDGASESRLAAAVCDVVRCEQVFVHNMQRGMQGYSRPLRHRIINTRQHAALFQNIEKVRPISSTSSRQAPYLWFFYLQKLIMWNGGLLICGFWSPFQWITSIDYHYQRIVMDCGPSDSFTNVGTFVFANVLVNNVTRVFSCDTECVV